MRHKLENKINQLQRDYAECLPEDFETKADLHGQIKGIQFLVDLIIDNKDPDQWEN